jgi:hypothetical protein
MGNYDSLIKKKKDIEEEELEKNPETLKINFENTKTKIEIIKETILSVLLPYNEKYLVAGSENEIAKINKLLETEFLLEEISVVRHMKEMINELKIYINMQDSYIREIQKCLEEFDKCIRGYQQLETEESQKIVETMKEEEIEEPFDDDKPKFTKECLQCGVEFITETSNQIYCSKCARKRKLKSKREWRLKMREKEKVEQETEKVKEIVENPITNTEEVVSMDQEEPKKDIVPN